MFMFVSDLCFYKQECEKLHLFPVFPIITSFICHYCPRTYFRAFFLVTQSWIYLLYVFSGIKGKGNRVLASVNRICVIHCM